jgi:hypothetical protein
VTDESHSPASPAPESAPVPAAITPKSIHLKTGSACGILVAVLAILAVWGPLEPYHPVFKPDSSTVPAAGPASPSEMAAFDVSLKAADLRNAILCLGLMGLITAGLLAAAEAWAQGRRAGVLPLALLGAVIGAAGGIGAGLLGEALIPALRGQGLSPLAQTISMQAAVFVTLGVAVMLGVTLANGNLRVLVNALIGGVLGGALAGMVYPFATAYLLPTAQTERVIPTTAISRLLWIGLPIFLIVVMATGLKKRPPRQAAASSPPPAAAPDA